MSVWDDTEVPGTAEILTAANPVDVDTARSPASEGGVPAKPGFYAWWLTHDKALPGVPTSPHPMRRELGLLYVGIAPNDEKSKSLLRTRVCGNHLGSSIGGSTLRFGLTSLLWEAQGWHPYATSSGKIAIPAPDRTALTEWMVLNLRVSWCCMGRPWAVERTLIQEVRPPLNSDHNQRHPFYETLREARKALAAGARAASASP